MRVHKKKKSVLLKFYFFRKIESICLSKSFDFPSLTFLFFISKKKNKKKSYLRLVLKAQL